CRGLRTSGQTAEGTTSFSTTPNPAIKSQILGSSGATEDLAVGKEHLCFTTTSNGVFCAGSNDYGELGDGFHTVGNPAGLSKATEVLSLAGLASKVTVGTHHSCVLTTGNGVSCWGENSLGQLGDGSNIATVVPISVQGLSFGVSALATGTHHNCVLTSTGGVKCWGRNTSGQLGDGTGISNNVPVDVVGLTSGVSSISVAGSTSCAVLTGGEARCWGRNTNGQIGDGTLVNKTSPVTVSGLGAGVASMAVGEFHNCSLSTLGAVKCWGSDYLCETGSNVNTCNTNVTSPQAVYGLTSGVERISSGNSFSCALMSNKAMRCWGSNASGQLGYGSTSYKYSSFTEVTAANAPYLTAQKLFLGSGTTCLVTAGKTAYCWGANNIGQRADGSADTPLNTMSPIGLLY
ncbi:MAG: RCC1 repeat-containing protein, partial [Sphingobacteriales bacterium]